MRFFEARESQMGRIRPALGSEAKLFHLRFDACGQFGKCVWRCNSGPEDSRPLRIGKKSEASHIDGEWLKAPGLRQRSSYLRNLCIGNRAQEFESKVNNLRARPAGIGGNSAKGFLSS